MSDSGNRNITPRRSGGVLYDLGNRARLIGRLMMDGRVNPFIKLLPVGALVYLIFPDIPGPVDDALIIWLGTYLFVELCPPNVVQEHLNQLQGVVPGQWDMPTTRPSAPPEDIIDGEYMDQSGRKGNQTPPDPNP